MKGGTLFSGIGAPECAAPDIDWRWCAETDPFASAVHAARFPGVPNLGDVNAIEPAAVEPVDLVVFGSPCQDFSVAGKRKGMAGERGNLSLVALALVAKLRPRWLVFENVPGLLSNWSGEAPGDLAEGEEREADQYSDFAALLGTVRECGYLGCWRVYDAQHFGVPQRRRRVFVVGHLGDWRPAAAVLFEPESLRGDPAPRREAGQGAAASPLRSSEGGGTNTQFRGDGSDNLIADPISRSENRTYTHEGRNSFRTHNLIPDIAWALQERDCKGADSSTKEGHLIPVAYDITGTGPRMRHGARETGIHTALRASHIPGGSEGSTTTVIAQTLRADGFDASEDGTGRGVPPTLAIRGILTPNGGRAGIGCGAIAFNAKWSSTSGTRFDSEIAPSLDVAKRDGLSMQRGMSVRRLTPIECERLQGFPDGWTAIRWRGKPAADGNRYRALGNSMAVPVVRWILGRIEGLR